MVSFVMLSLFTKYPEEDSLSLLSPHFADNILALFKLLHTYTYFCFHGQYFEQIDGVAMSSSHSPVIAKSSMEEFEEKALNQATFKPTCWYTYVDDKFVIWPHGKENLTDFLEHLSGIHKK